MSMAQIAKLAGVSTATVCRVLRESPLVRQETATQVLDVIKKVGYVPQPPRTGGRRKGQSLAKGDVKDRRIAVITLGQSYQNWLSVPMIGSFVAGVTSAAQEFDVDVLLDEMPQPLEPSRLVKRGEIGGAILLVDSAVSRSPEGVQAMQMLAQKLPVVWAMGAHVGPVQIDHISPDNLGIGHIAAAYLAARGCRRVAFVTTEPRWPLTRLRAMAFAAAADDAGLEVASYLVADDKRDGRIYPGPVTVVPTLADAVDAMKRSDALPHGLFLPRDYETARLYPVLAQAGIRPQRDIQIVSCDNDASQMSLMDPPPATIDINTREIARRAIRRLRMRMRNNDESPILIHVHAQLIEPAPIGKV